MEPGLQLIMSYDHDNLWDLQSPFLLLLPNPGPGTSLVLMRSPEPLGPCSSNLLAAGVGQGLDQAGSACSASNPLGVSPPSVPGQNPDYQ